jgi:hypothetical protein
VVLRNQLPRPSAEDDVPDELQAIEDPQEAARWLEQNGDELSDSQKQIIRSWLEMRAVGDPSGAWREVADVAINLQETGTPSDDEDRESNEAAGPTMEEFYNQWQEQYPNAPVQRADLIDIARAEGAADPEATVDAFIE